MAAIFFLFVTAFYYANFIFPFDSLMPLRGYAYLSVVRWIVDVQKRYKSSIVAE